MKKILIVDDEEDMLWTLSRNLCHDGLQAEILTAHSGEAALAVLNGTPVDLVVTDIIMSGMSGIELLIEIKNRSLRTGVIVMTAYPSRACRTDALLHGGMQFIEKPFDIKKLRGSISRALADDLFGGTVCGVQLGDIIQINCLSNATSSLRVSSPEGAGIIYTVAGKIVHAICEDLEGEEAFHKILGLSCGIIENVKSEPCPETSISKGVEPLLIESMRRHEAMKRTRQAETGGAPPDHSRTGGPAPHQGRQEFTGVVAGMPLADIIQLTTLSLVTTTLRISSAAGEGLLHIVDGAVVHAECGDCRGEEAFYRIMTFDGGKVDRMPPAAAVCENTIEKGFEALLLESARRADERNGEKNQQFPAERSKLSDAHHSIPKENNMAELKELLVEFTNIPGVSTVCLVGRDGFLLDSMAPQGIDSEMIGAIASGGFGASESMGNQLAKGNLTMTMIEYESGPVMLSPIGEEAFLVVVAGKESNLGMIRLKIKKHAKEIQSAASI
jgi:hypothetical protein